VTLGMTEGTHSVKRTLSGCPPKSSTLTNQREMGEMFGKNRCQIEIEANITTGKKKVSFDIVLRMHTGSESKIACSNFGLSPRLVPDLNNSSSHSSKQAMSLGTHYYQLILASLLQRMQCGQGRDQSQ
jgi:hypothetical protein